MWSSHTMECYSAIKKEQLLICTLTKVHLKITPEQKKKSYVSYDSII